MVALQAGLRADELLRANAGGLRRSDDGAAAARSAHAPLGQVRGHSTVSSWCATVIRLPAVSAQPTRELSAPLHLRVALSP
jgi:hypothetical protein